MSAKTVSNRTAKASDEKKSWKQLVNSNIDENNQIP